uniref:Pancreatic progenitor cell differentiation and proliferation factor a n=1 Tax=Oryzias sinensis TaxID=183150 RepID=A0A8C7ZEM0_9TELE
MAAIPSSGSLIATHDYYRRRLGSSSSSSSCGSSEYTGEVIPHHPGLEIDSFLCLKKRILVHRLILQYFLYLSALPRQDSGHWWTSFFFTKQNPANGSDNQKTRSYTVANGQVSCIAKEMVLNRQLSESSESGKVEPTTPPPVSS